VNRRTQLAVICSSIALLAGGAGAAWMLRDRFSDAPKPTPARAEYDEMVGRLGGDEQVLRAELNVLATTASAPRDPADESRADALTRECLDPKILLEIGFVRTFVAAAKRGEPAAYHFVSEAHRARLREIAGDDPSPEKVLAVRKALAILADEFETIRVPQDWSVKVEGEKARIPLLEWLRNAQEFLPAGQHPNLVAEPRIPAFAGADGELLDQLDRYFNGERARAAFPPAKFPKLYRDGRIPPIPTALQEYTKEIEEAVLAEKAELVQVGDPERIEAVNDVYARLNRFLSAVIRFGK